jgi:hypothetical protein
MLKSAIVFLLALFIARADGQELKKIKIGYPAISDNKIHLRKTWIPALRPDSGHAFAGKAEGAGDFQSTMLKSLGFELSVVNANVGCQTVREVRT